MMKKQAWLKWGILSVVLITLLWLVATLITSIPVYPAFQKQVDSYGELQQCLEDIPEVILPDTSILEFQDETYVLRLDDRNLLSKPNGYEYCGTMLYDGVEVSYDLNCDKATKLHSSTGTVYRDIQLDYFTWEPAEDSGYKRSGMEFFIGDYHYFFYASYVKSELSKNEAELVDNKIATQMMMFANNIIDMYLDG